jgi:hypothetical protein
MAMKKILSLLLASCATVLVTGCLIGETDELFNASGFDLTSISFGSTNGPVVHALRRGESAIIGMQYSFELHHGDQVWFYSGKPFVGEYRRAPGEKKLMKFYKPFGHTLLVKMQVQPDGSIYLVNPDSAGAVQSFFPQPAGFPLEPRER